MSSLTMYESVEPVMGTLARISIRTRAESQARVAFVKAFARLRETEAIFSDYQIDSEAMRLCRTATGRAMPVSHEMFTVLERAQRLSAETDGAFDVTLGPLTRLRREKRPLGEAEVAEARLRTGYGNVVLDARERTVRLLWPNMILDFGAIAKGFAADEAIRLLEEPALIAISGDIVAGAGSWRVAIPMPPGTLQCERSAVSTSGDSEQSYAGRSHILDPATGLGMQGPITVSVAARDGMTADSLATALRVLGPDRGIPLLARYPGARAWFQTA